MHEKYVGENVILYEVLPFANVTTLVMVRRTFGKYLGNGNFQIGHGFIRDHVFTWSEFVQFMVDIRPEARYIVRVR